MQKDFLSNLLRHETYVITTHIRPDGDAIGSQLALGLFLKKLGKRVTMINSDVVPRNLEWMAVGQGIEVFNNTLEQRTHVVNAEAVVVVDINGLNRLGDLAGPVAQNLGPKYLIDHHPNPEGWFKHTFVRTSASSTGELIYELLEAYALDLIDTDIATALYTAIVTDTGSFRYNTVTPRVHEITADLLRRGSFNPEPIHVSVYNNQSFSSLRLLALGLESIRLMYGDTVGYMVIRREMLQRADASLDETEGFVDYVMSIDGVKAGVLFLDLNRNVKASFRSVGDWSVSEWARHFGGGGHRNASGAYMTGTIDHLVPRVMKAAPQFLPLGEEELHAS